LEDAQEEYEEALRVAEMRYQRAIAYSTMITHYVSSIDPSISILI
jgi:hypothetical protein